MAEIVNPETTITLPSGKAFAFREGRGRDLRKAARIVNPGEDAVGYSMAIASITGTIDGQPFTVEDMDDMPMTDVNAMMGALGGKS